MLVRPVLAAVFTLLLAAPASAQTTFGAKLGVQAASVSFDADTEDNFTGPGTDLSGRLGFVLGATADVPVRGPLSFRPEVLYTQKGFRQVFSADGGVLTPNTKRGGGLGATTTFAVDYIEVPLLVAYTVTQPSGLSFSGEAGPTLALLLASDTSISCDEGCENAEGESLDDIVDGFDLGVAVGATVGSGPFGGGLRYTRALSNAFQAEGFNQEATWTNSAFTATLHYRFGAQ